jgi:hypothetical protein
VSSIIYFWSRRPVAIGDALAGSLYSQCGWSRGNAQGDRLACAQKILEPTHVRLLRRNTVFVASNVSSIICSWSRRPLAIGRALAGSHDGQRDWSRGNAQGDRLACAQKILEPTHIRLLRGHSGLRSIECEFDHLFLVETSLGNRQRACRIPLRSAPFVAWECARRSVGLRAENIRADSRQAATGPFGSA